MKCPILLLIRTRYACVNISTIDLSYDFAFKLHHELRRGNVFLWWREKIRRLRVMPHIDLFSSTAPSSSPPISFKNIIFDALPLCAVAHYRLHSCSTILLGVSWNWECGHSKGWVSHRFHSGRIDGRKGRFPHTKRFPFPTDHQWNSYRS